MMRRGDTELQRSGPTCAIGDDAFSMIHHAVLSKICLTQMNGDAELKENDLVSCIRNLGTRITGPRNLWRKLKAENAICLELSREVQVELRRQIWTTATNLGDLYDHFEHSALNTALATMVGVAKLSSQMTRSDASRTCMRPSSPWMGQMEKLEDAQQTPLPLLVLQGLAPPQKRPA
jgi:hypothetical protein